MTDQKGGTNDEKMMNSMIIDNDSNCIIRWHCYNDDKGKAEHSKTSRPKNSYRKTGPSERCSPDLSKLPPALCIVWNYLDGRELVLCRVQLPVPFSLYLKHCDRRAMKLSNRRQEKLRCLPHFRS